MKNQVKRIINLCLISLSLLAIACGGASKDKKETTGPQAGAGDDSGPKVSQEAKEDFGDAATKYRNAEKEGWTAANCKAVVSEFEDVAKNHDNMAEAMYNVGVVYKKCGMDNEAKTAFRNVVSRYPNHQLSLCHLAVMALEKGDMAEGENLLRQSVSAGQRSAEVVPSYVNAATILRKKGAANKDEASLDKAQMNIRRALAIDDKNMSALYQLAMLYMDTAALKKNVSFLTLAQLVCTQAIRLNPEYGPIYHVLGQVFLKQGELVEALKSFQTAFQKDPKLFASYMNYAAINLNFRGYQEAKMAFEKAIGLDPKSYEAQMGLGVALRGLNDLEGAKAQYKKASEINSRRTDYVFNMGVLEMDYLNQGTLEGYDKAKSIFEKFIASASEDQRKDPDGTGPELSLVQRAQKRIDMCVKNKNQLIQAEKEMAEMAKLQKENAAREAEMQKALEKAKELEQKEAGGAIAPEDNGAPVEGGAQPTAATPATPVTGTPATGTPAAGAPATGTPAAAAKPVDGKP